MSDSPRVRLSRVHTRIAALALQALHLEDQIAAADYRRRYTAAKHSHRRYDARDSPQGSATVTAGARRPSPRRAPANTPARKPVPGPQMPASPRRTFPEAKSR